jgi:hypothetical protein
VLARDPDGRSSDAADSCPDERFGPAEILKYVVQGWSLEVTVAEARAPPGLETPRPGSDLAMARATPALLGLFSVVTLLAVQWHRAGLLVAEPTAWYEKECPTSSACIRLVRQQIWRGRIRGPSSEVADVIISRARVFCSEFMRGTAIVNNINNLIT